MFSQSKHECLHDTFLGYFLKIEMFIVHVMCFTRNKIHLYLKFTKNKQVNHKLYILDNNFGMWNFFKCTPFFGADDFICFNILFSSSHI